MNRMYIAAGVLAILAIAAVLGAGCTGKDTTQPVTLRPTTVITPGPVPVPTNAGETTASQTVAGAGNRFAYDLYGRLANDPAQKGQNIFFSPYSISNALALAGEGAYGTTRSEILTVLHLPANDTVRREGFASLNAGIGTPDSGYTLDTANALWAEKSYAFLPSYIAIAGRYYAANATNLDFFSDPEGSRQTINRWVGQRTAGKIPVLLPQGSIDSLTRLVITNAVYFKGTWDRQFNPKATTDADFRTSSGGTVKVRMMQDTGHDARYPYAETDRVQYIELPYSSASGRSLSMGVILPKDDSITAAESLVASGGIPALQQSAYTRHVLLSFPKFTVETSYALPATLQSMGMKAAFGPGADFSGMDGTRNLSITDVFHKAYIDVNEQGTEAAAATAVVIGVAAAAPEQNPLVFRADHPFIFFIQDRDSGAILFMGKVENPAGG